MTIYSLYVKTHNKTGLKYLGQTKVMDPHKYKGSGVDWTTHLKEYGSDYTTEIIYTSQYKDEVNDKGLFYSKLWNVVNGMDDFGNKIWANRIPEKGAGGGSGPHTPETVAKILETKLKKYGTLKSNTPESIKQSVETRRKNDSYKHSLETKVKIKQSMTGVSRSVEAITKGKETARKNGSYAKSADTINKIMATKKLNGTVDTTSQQSIANMIESKRKNGTLNVSPTPEAIAKRVATRKKDGSYAKTPEIIAKMLETRKRNKIKNQ